MADISTYAGIRDRPLKVLLIEDDEDDFALVRDYLAAAEGGGFRLEWASTYADGLRALTSQSYDVCLLDYLLGAANGLDLLRQARKGGCEIPMIFVTAFGDDRNTVVEALRLGAADYLPKSQIDGPLLERSLRYTVERHELLMQLEEARELKEREEELLRLDRLSGASPAPMTALAFGFAPLRVGMPARFHVMVERYRNLLEGALTAQTYKLESSLQSEEVARLADDLGALKAGPRDVIDIHSSAMKGGDQRATQQRRRAMIEEGRLLLLELMGRLVSHYRSYAISRAGGPSENKT